MGFHGSDVDVRDRCGEGKESAAAGVFGAGGYRFP